MKYNNRWSHFLRQRLELLASVSGLPHPPNVHTVRENEEWRFKQLFCGHKTPRSLNPVQTLSQSSPPPPPTTSSFHPPPSSSHGVIQWKIRVDNLSAYGFLILATLWTRPCCSVWLSGEAAVQQLPMFNQSQTFTQYKMVWMLTVSFSHQGLKCRCSSTSVNHCRCWMELTSKWAHLWMTKSPLAF